MKNGQTAFLAPCSSNLELGKSSKTIKILKDCIKSISEEVTIVKITPNSNNAKVKDRKGLVFFCSVKDLYASRSLVFPRV